MNKKIVILFLIAAASVFAADKIKLRGQKDFLEVRIERDTWKGLEYTTPDVGQPFKMDWDRIEDYKYGDMRGAPYERGLIYYKRGAYREAYTEFVRTTKLAKYNTSAWAKSYCNYYAGMCLYYLGLKVSDEEKRTKVLNGAITHFEKSMGNPDSHFEPDCIINTGKVQMAIGEFDKAKQTLAKITKAYGDAKYAEAKQLITDAQYKGGDYAGARKQYENILDDLRDKNGPTGLELKTKIGLCFMYEGNIAKGRGEIEKAISKGVELKFRGRLRPDEIDPILAFAYKAKGDTYSESTEKDPKKALRAYLHTAVTYKASGRKEAIAEASYKAGVALNGVLETEKDPEVRKQMIEKAKELLGQARALYGASNVKMQRKINKVMQDLPSR